MRATALVFLIALACGSETKSGTRSSSTDEDTTSKTKSDTAKPSQSAPTRPAPTNKEPEKLTAPIRENVASGDFKDGAAFEARLFVSKLTKADNLHLAMHFKLEKPLENDDPRRKATMDAGELLPSLKFEVTSPTGKTTLHTAQKLGENQLGIAWFEAEYTLDGRGVSQFGKMAAWEKPEPDLFAKAGKYSIAVSGNLKMADRTVAIGLKPLEFEIVEPGADMKTLAELAQIASEIVQKKQGLGKPPQSFTAVVDDVDGNRWHRYQVDAGGNTPHAGYDVQIIEILLDPAGKELNYDTFPHFTCIAEGVTIATPGGSVPVENLRDGDSVVSYDVATKTKKISLVEHVSAAHAERLVRIGDLLVTGAHPIFTGDHFELAQNLAPASDLLGLDLTARQLSPVELELPTTVYELTVSEPHTYFAGGLLVHNKAVYQPVGGQKQPWQGWFYRRAVKR